jgi:hypothetical protein
MERAPAQPAQHHANRSQLVFGLNDRERCLAVRSHAIRLHVVDQRFDE